MKNLKVTTTDLQQENEEIKRIFDGQANFLKGLMIFSVVQYVILLVVI
ncbi:MAG: hypothetical protein WA913_08575 [Pricia sp.]